MYMYSTGNDPELGMRTALDQCSCCCCLQHRVLVLADVDNPTEFSTKLCKKTVAGPVRMVFVNFYSRNGTRAQDPGLAPLEKKLDGIFNNLTQQNHQMTTLQEQGEQTLLHMGESRRSAVLPEGKS